MLTYIEPYDLKKLLNPILIITKDSDLVKLFFNLIIQEKLAFSMETLYWPKS